MLKFLKVLKSEDGATGMLEVAILLVFVMLQIIPSVINISHTLEQLLQTLDQHLWDEMSTGF
jgi:Flp pilus assembly pilin Flp